MSDLVEKILMEGLLFEGKNIGTLYHFTSIIGLGKILKGNDLHPNRRRISFNNKLIYIISTTRDKNFYKTSNRLEDGVSGISCRIALNGNKLSENYKILPFNYFNMESLESESTSDATRPKNTESEQIIITKKEGLINLKKYIIDITIFPIYDQIQVFGKAMMNEELMKILEVLKKMNIPFEIKEK